MLRPACPASKRWAVRIDEGRFHDRIASWIPNHVAGLCSDADSGRADEAGERERQARQRDSAEAMGDPRR